MKTRVSKISNVIFSLAFCMGLASCNKEDYYQKDYLQNPFQDPTTTGSVDSGAQGGVDAGNIGDTQGGVNSGTNGGTSGSATGSTTSGTDGSVTGGVTGGTTGGVDGSTTAGSTTGTTTGGTTGTVDGTTTAGSSTGSTTGGATTGGTTGGVDGTTTSGSTTGSTTGGTTTQVPVEESFQQAASETKKLDIVWIIDDSGSMDDEQAALGTNFSAFINDFITKNVDFKMAITTTDCSSTTRCGHLVTGSDTKLTSAKAQANETQFKTDFQNLVKVGTSGSGYEMGLKASEGFMQKFGTTFLRPDAYLAVVVISDEEDQSPKTVNEYTDYLKSFKQEAGLVKVYSIVDVNLTNAQNQTNGITAGFQRYADASHNTAGTVADIRADFYRTLDDMGNTIIQLLDSFALANAAVAGSIKVWVNGVETTGFTYDSVSHSIKFNADNIPATGATIKVQYLKQ